MSSIAYDYTPTELGLWTNPEPPTVFVVIPTFNEADNLPRMASALFNLFIPRLNLLVVDDNSPDGTGQIAERLRKQYNGRVHVIHRPEKNGLGQAYLQGFRYALDQGADLIIQMDCDFSHSPEVVPQFISLAQDYDVVLGSRYIDGARLDPRWSFWRNLLSRWANSVYVRLLLGLKVADATGGFKCWNRPVLEAVLEHPITSSGFIFQVETNLLAERLGYVIHEIPIYFADRTAGESKMDSSIKVEAAMKTWELRRRYQHLRPVKQPAVPATARVKEIAR